jgi:hypothetical protein
LKSPYAIIVVFVVFLLLSTPLCLGGKKIKTLIAGDGGIIQNLAGIFDFEPLVNHDSVVVRSFAFTKVEDNMKLIRLYFPRTYEKMKTYDLILLVAAEYNLLTPRQDKWIYDAIREGASGINDGSLFSIISPIADVWASSQAQQAFPNDVVAVSKVAWRNTMAYEIRINPDHPEPIITPFIPFGSDKVRQWGAVGWVIPREAADVLAWQIGSFPTRVALLANWEYENGRTMTSGQFLGGGWLGYPLRESTNQYSLEMFMNMVFWLTKRPLIDDIVVFHRVKTGFHEFRSRLGILISLRDFIDKFGANTQKIQDEIMKLQVAYEDAQELYLDSSFIDSETAIKQGLALFAEAEDIARREKDAALLWVYIIEWLVASSTMFFSGFVLWTLMVKRRLYHEVNVTRLEDPLD